jgi:hypothetical protein
MPSASTLFRILAGLLRFRNWAGDSSEAKVTEPPGTESTLHADLRTEYFALVGLVTSFDHVGRAPRRFRQQHRPPLRYQSR